jgi:hypothetical protein
VSKTNNVPVATVSQTSSPLIASLDKQTSLDPQLGIFV